MTQTDRHLNTLVIGKAKTGTTAISSLLLEESGAENYILEPKGVLDILNHPKYDENKSHVDKIIFEHFIDRIRHLNALVHNQLYIQYDKVVLIKRDLRDEMLSRMLYLSKAMANQKHPRESWEKWRDVLRRKEEDPKSMSFRDVCIAFAEIFNGNAWLDVVQHHSNTERDYRTFLNQSISRDHYVVAYEDMIDNKIEGLEEYMGFSFSKHSSDVSLGNFEYTKRSASYGGWREFFLPSDVKRIRRVLKNKGLDDFADWELKPVDHLDPKLFSEYVWKLSGQPAK